MPVGHRRFADQRSNAHYRPDIDGLRALAVLGVMTYHAGFGLSGGFVGVDVFFVISGYLITRGILQELQSGKFRMQRFWERRVRRILPASLVSMVVVLAAGFFLLSPYDYEQLAQAAICQVFFLGNIFHWMDTNYFAGQAELKPLLHTWSLAIEEQFYLGLPILLWLVFQRSRKAALRCLMLLALASLAASIVLTPQAPSAAFYLLPTRAWELLAGSLIAFRRSETTVANPAFAIRSWIASSAFVGLVVAMLLMQADQRFPGYLACIPVGCTVVLIDVHRHGQTWVSHVLGSKWLVAIGLISYSLYLWHWPLMAFTRYVLPLAPPELMLLPFLASFPFGLFSWKWIECPFREWQWRGTRLMTYAGCALLVPIVASIVIWQQDGFPQRIASREKLPPPPAELLSGRYRTSPVDFTLDELPLLGARDVEPRFIVWGDSHAMALAPLIDEIASEHGQSFYLVARGGTPPLADCWRADASQGDKEQCVRWNANVLQAMQATDCEVILVIAGWQIYVHETGLQDTQSTSISAESTMDVLRRQVPRTADLMPDGASIFWLSPAPRQSADLARVVKNQALYSWSSELPAGLTRAEHDLQIAEIAAVFQGLEAAQHIWLDASAAYFDIHGQAILFSNNAFCYVDDNHVSMAGARLYFADAIRQIMDQFGKANKNSEVTNSRQQRSALPDR